MSVRVTRIVGYGIYMSLRLFKTAFESEEDYEKFADAHSKLEVNKTCYVEDLSGGEWAFYGKILHMAIDRDGEELPNIDLDALPYTHHVIDCPPIPMTPKFMYLTQYA